MHTNDTLRAGAGGHCWLCSMPSGSLDYHAMDANIFERSACTNDNDSQVGVQLCPMCHTAVHRWMRSHGHETGHPAADAVDAVFTRFTNALINRADINGRKRP